MVSLSPSAEIVYYDGNLETNIYNVKAAVGTTPYTTDFIFGVNYENSFGTMQNSDSFIEVTEATDIDVKVELLAYKPTYTGSITDAIQTDKHTILGYKDGLLQVG